MTVEDSKANEVPGDTDNSDEGNVIVIENESNGLTQSSEDNNNGTPHVDTTESTNEKAEVYVAMTDLKPADLPVKKQIYEEFVLKELTDVTGEYGPWQRSILILCLLTCFPYVWQELNYGFHIYPLDHWCSAPDEIRHLLNTSESLQKWKSAAIPKNEDLNEKGQSHCKIFENSFEHEREWGHFLSDGSSKFLEGSQVIPCKSWDFDHGFYGETIIERWHLVCRKADQIYLGRLIYTVGFIISAIVFGKLGDTVGRRPVMLICLTLLHVTSFFIAFSNSYVFYVVLRFAVAMGTAGLFVTSIVMLMEISGPKERPLMGIMMALVSSVALLILPGIAWLAKDWVILQLATSIPCFILVVFWWSMPESPRWLLSTGRLEKARAAVEKAADANNKSVAQIYINSNALFKHFEKKFKMQIIMSDYATIDKISLMDVHKSSALRLKILIIYVSWFVSSLTYNGLSLEDDGITDDLFTNFAIFGAVQIPTILITYIAITKLGRRIPLSITIMVACITCLVLIPLNDNFRELRAVFTIIGNALLTSSTAILYILTSELLPTPARNTGVGVSFAFAGFGAILAPFISDIATVAGRGVPLGIFAALSAITACVVLRLPETNDRHIADDMDDAEALTREPCSAETDVENTTL